MRPAAVNVGVDVVSVVSVRWFSSSNLLNQVVFFVSSLRIRK